MKKIIHVQLLPLISGVQKVSLDELSRLNPLEFDRIVVCNGEGDFTRSLRLLGIRVYICESLKRQISPINDFLAFVNLFLFFLREKPDIVHTHSSKPGIIGRLAAYAANVKLILHTVHGYAFNEYNPKIVNYFYMYIEKFATFFSHYLLLLHKSDAKIAINILKIPEKKVKVLTNGIDTNLYSPVCIEEKKLLRSEIFGVEDSDSSTVLVGMVGRIWEQKNPSCLVESVKIISSRINNCFFYLIGDGPLRYKIEKDISDNQLNHCIFITGWRSDIPKVLKTLDIIVQPSKWEGLPLTLLEAMSSEVPVIASNISGNRDLISHNHDGLLFPVNSHMDMAGHLINLIDNVSYRNLLGKNARQKVIMNYSIEQHMKELLKLYNNDNNC